MEPEAGRRTWANGGLRMFANGRTYWRQQAGLWFPRLKKGEEVQGWEELVERVQAEVQGWEELVARVLEEEPEAARLAGEAAAARRKAQVEEEWDSKGLGPVRVGRGRGMERVGGKCRSGGGRGTTPQRRLLEDVRGARRRPEARRCRRSTPTCWEGADDVPEGWWFGKEGGWLVVVVAWLGFVLRSLALAGRHRGVPPE